MMIEADSWNQILKGLQDKIKQYQSENATLKAENERFRKVLKKYADNRNWASQWSFYANEQYGKDLAKQALEGLRRNK